MWDRDVSLAFVDHRSLTVLFYYCLSRLGADWASRGVDRGCGPGHPKHYPNRS